MFSDFFMSQTVLLLFFIVAIMDLSFSFLPVEGKKRITCVRFVLYSAMHNLSQFGESHRADSIMAKTVYGSCRIRRI